jgi:hypothetical protein
LRSTVLRTSPHCSSCSTSTLAQFSDHHPFLIGRNYQFLLLSMKILWIWEQFLKPSGNYPFQTPMATVSTDSWCSLTKLRITWVSAERKDTMWSPSSMTMKPTKLNWKQRPNLNKEWNSSQ